MENILDSLAMTFPCVEQDSPVSELCVMSSEKSGGDALLSPQGRPAFREFLVGTGGALLVHLAAAGAVLLLPFVQSPQHPPEPFFNVYMVGLQGMGNGPGGMPGSGTGGETVREEPPPEPKPEVRTAPPEMPKPVVKAERTMVTEKTQRKKIVKAETKQSVQNHPVASAVEDTASTPAPVSEGVHPAVPGASGLGTASGGGTGASAGGNGSGGASAGMGRLQGEFDAAAVDQPPQVVAKSAPVYPNKARNMGIGGKVVLRFLVGPDGHVSRSAVLASHPPGYFEQSALDAVSHWRFKPGSVKGRAVATWVTLPVQFRLVDQE